MNHSTYSPLVREFYEEQVGKFNLDEVNMLYVTNSIIMLT